MHLNRDRKKCGDVDRNSLSMVDWRMRPTRRQHALVIMVECIAENIKEVYAHRPPHPAACVAVGSPASPCQKLNQPQRPDCSGRHRRTERAAEWTHAPCLMKQRSRGHACSLPCRVFAERGRHQVARHPCLFGNKPSRRAPLVIGQLGVLVSSRHVPGGARTTATGVSLCFAERRLL